MIIDEQADFRSLLMHHVTSHWPDSVITAYDPTSAGHLPDEFSGAGNDLVLLGDRHGDDRDGIDVLRRFVSRRGFPPIVYFASGADEQAAGDLAPGSYFPRDRIRHETLVKRLDEALHVNTRLESSQPTFVGDPRTGIYPSIKGYRVVRKIGATRFSGVYLAKRESTKREVVLKVLWQPPARDDESGTFDRFLQEYETIAEMDHPNIVRIHDLGVADDHAHIAMEYLDDGDLRQRINQGMSSESAVACLQQIAGGLSAVHAQGVLHRDLKPANVMFRSDGSVALIDFGLAKRARLVSEITDKGEIFGTPYYMSPEQGHGGVVDQRSDIYSLGVVFYEMLTGKKPYEADTAMGIIFQHANAPIPLLPARTARFQMLINLMLAKAPDDRLQHAAEVDEWLA